MISISKKIISTLLFALLFGVFTLPGNIYAQQSLALTVSPTLFEMAATPGQSWKSSIKVVNSNQFDIMVYPTIVNFAPQGETGQGKFIPVFEDVTGGATLAEWVELSPSAVTIPREQSREIPFSVLVPADASPGGHYAAILISTRPPESDKKSLVVRTAQIVTSLFFVRVAGDVVESATIRSFSVTNTFSSSPTAEFELRFENKGNVHLQPRGEITILNMWGKERGSIPINHRTHFGNVLPDSIRNFKFSWTGEQSFSDIGRYKAIASLGYGVGTTQFVSSATYFWVIPLKALAITLSSILAFIFIVTWAIKLYVRRMLVLAGVAPQAYRPARATNLQDGDVAITNYRTITGPVRSGYTDLRNQLAATSAITDVFTTLGRFLVSYRVFFVLSLLLIGGLSGIYYFVLNATQEGRNYNIVIDNPDTTTTLSAEEVVFGERANGQSITTPAALENQIFSLTLLNTSGKVGTAAEVALALVKAGYQVTTLGVAPERIDKKSVIVFDPELQAEALKLSKQLGGALLSARTGSSAQALPDITIYIGEEQRK